MPKRLDGPTKVRLKVRRSALDGVFEIAQHGPDQWGPIYTVHIDLFAPAVRQDETVLDVDEHGAPT